MSYDYSTIIAMYKDGMELFRLYEGSVMLWEKPLKRFYVYVDQLATLQSVIDKISAMTGYVVKMRDIVNFNSNIKAAADSGYLIEMYVEDGLDGSAKPSILTDLQNIQIDEEESLSNSIEAIPGQASSVRLTENSEVNNSITVMIDNNVYYNVSESILFNNQINNILVGSIWYIPRLNDTIYLNNTIKSIVAAVEYVRLNVADSLTPEIKPTVVDELNCEIHIFDSLSTYIEFIESNGLFTSISATDGLDDSIRITMFRFSELRDFDNLYLYDIDGETLEELKLIEE